MGTRPPVELWIISIVQPSCNNSERTPREHQRGTYLRYHLFVSLSCHVRMRVRVDGDISALLENGREFRGVVEDIDTNEEMRSRLILLSQKLNEFRGSLCDDQTSAYRLACGEGITYGFRSIVEANSDVAIWRIPDIVGISALVRCRANLVAHGVKPVRVSWRTASTD